MCTGIEIALALGGAALSAGGAYMQQNEAEANARRQAEARNERLNITLKKNDQLADDSREAFDARAKQVQEQEMQQGQQKATDERQATLDQAVETSPAADTGEIPLAGSAPAVVKSELAKRIGEAIKGSKDSAARQAKLSGYGDSWLDQGFQDVETGRNLAQNANFAGGNMAIMPYQQDIAEMRAYKPISPMGGLLQGFGSAVSSFGGSGGMVKKKSYTSPASTARAGYL